MSRTGFNMTIKQLNVNRFGIYAVSGNQSVYQVAEIEMPHDGQQLDNLRTCEAIADILKKRVRRSIT